MAAPTDQTTDVRLPDPHLPDTLPPDPFPLLVSWFEDAVARRVQPNPNAMTLATVGRDDRPSARIVLCKGINPQTGSLVFYTNYGSRKGEDLAANPHAAAVFFWDSLDRQARIEGPVVKSPGPESDAYFGSRPMESRIGAWASDQSRPIASRSAMAERVTAAMQRLGIKATSGSDAPVPRPPHWGGYRLFADRVEFWVSGSGRVHDRAVWTRSLTRHGDGFTGGVWSRTRLQP